MRERSAHHPLPPPVLALLLMLPVPSLAVAAGMFWWPESGVGQTLFLLAKLWILLVPAYWHLRVERQPLSWSPARHGGLAAAFLLGLPIAAAIVGAFVLVRAHGWIDPTMVRERAQLTGLADPRIYLGVAAYWITANSLMEEYVWRWFIFRQFERIAGGRAAVGLSALGFTGHHIIALAAQFDWRVNALASTGVFLGGLIWSWLYLRYRSIWPCWLCHAIADVPIFVIGWLLIFR
jgi:hypothetical protein